MEGLASELLPLAELGIPVLPEFAVPKGWKPEEIDYEKAMALISLPRDIGKHPETGKMISSGIGRYGPFLLHDGSYANLETVEDVFSVGLNRAVTVIAEKANKAPGRGARGTPAALKTLVQLYTRTTFNAVTVDGDRSTNDTLLLVATFLFWPQRPEWLRRVEPRIRLRG